MVVMVGVVLVGCASSSIQTDAGAFLREHGSTAARAAAATKAVELEVSHLAGAPSALQLRELARAAARARREAVRASEWDVAKSGEGGEEGAEEEDLPRAETEATAAAGELAGAMSALAAYVRSPSATALARYTSTLASARRQWNESVSQLWFLAHASDPPTV